jgi:hypothetical protein
MLDRQKIEAILRKRFPEAGPKEVAAAANAIMGLDEEWEEVTGSEGDVDQVVPPDPELRVFRRRAP